MYKKFFMKVVKKYLIFITVIALIFSSKVSFSATSEQIKTYAPKCIEVLESEKTTTEKGIRGRFDF
jgi:hypothetical protein